MDFEEMLTDLTDDRAEYYRMRLSRKTGFRNTIIKALERIGKGVIDLVNIYLDYRTESEFAERIDEEVEESRPRRHRSVNDDSAGGI